jgi:hypothetical protein
MSPNKLASITKGIFSFILSFALVSAAYAKEVKLVKSPKEDDGMSKTEYGFFGLPGYAKSGNLDQIILTNPQIENPDKITPIADEKLLGEKDYHFLSEQFSSFHKLSAIFGFFTSHIKATDPNTSANAHVYSDKGLIAKVVYERFSGSKFHHEYSLEVKSISYKKPDVNVNQYQLLNTSFTLPTLGYMGYYRFNPYWSLGGGVDYNKQLFLKGIATTIVQFEAAFLGRVKTDLTFHITFPTISIDLRGGVYLVIPKQLGNYKTSLNQNYFSDIILTKHIGKTWSASVGSRVEYFKQNTSIVKQSDTNSGFFVKIGAPF